MKLPPKKNIQLFLIPVKDDFHHLKTLSTCSIPKSIGKGPLEQQVALVRTRVIEHHCDVQLD
jgi:hypothetical protein